MRNIKGFSLIELLVVVAIFTVVMMGLNASYITLTRQGVKEFKLAESEMEIGIAKNIIDRDLNMAGYGLMNDNSAVSGLSSTLARSVSVTDAGTITTYDTLTLMGTALGMASRAAQGWSYVSAVTGTSVSFRSWNDAREDAVSTDRVVLINSDIKKVLAQGTEWLFKYNGQTANLTTLAGDTAYSEPSEGLMIYGLNHSGTSEASQPFYAVRYYLADPASSVPPAICAPGTRNLLRAESRSSLSPTGGDPIINCVLDFQVALGIDTDIGDGTKAVTFWDNGGVTAAAYSQKELNEQLLQVRVYALVQEGNKDLKYTYSNPDPAYSGTPAVVRVGDLNLIGGATGRDYTLTSDQRKYRWKIITFAVSPRNVR